MSVQTDIHRLVRELRERTGFTQEKFATRLGVTFSTISRWENGRAKPSLLALKQVEDLLRDMGGRGKDLLQEFFPDEASLKQPGVQTHSAGPAFPVYAFELKEISDVFGHGVSR